MLAAIALASGLTIGIGGTIPLESSTKYESITIYESYQSNGYAPYYDEPPRIGYGDAWRFRQFYSNPRGSYLTPRRSYMVPRGSGIDFNIWYRKVK
jgi:hypothetical protein